MHSHRPGDVWPIYYAQVGLGSALCAISVAFAIAAFFCVKSRNDSLRKWTRWYKVAFVLFVLFSAFSITVSGLNLAWRRKVEQTRSMSSRLPYMYPQAFTQYFRIFFFRMSQIFIFMCLVSLGSAVAISRGGSSSRIFRYASYALSFAVGALVLSNWAVYTSLIAWNWEHRNDEEEDTYEAELDYERRMKWFFDRTDAMKRLDFVLQILFAALALAVLVRSLLVWIRTRKSVTSNKSHLIYLLACCALFALRTLYDLSETLYHRAYLIERDAFVDKWRPWTEAMLYVYEILENWPLLVLLILLFFLGLDKNENGLWSWDAQDRQGVAGGAESKDY